MTTLELSILAASVVNLVFAAVIYFHSQRDRSSLFFSFLALTVAIWALGTLMMVSRIVPFSVFKGGSYIHFISGNSIFLFFFWFAWYFKGSFGKKALFPIIVSLIAMALFYTIIFTQFFFLGFTQANDLSQQIIFNHAGSFVNVLFFVILFLLSEVLLFKKYFIASNPDKTQLKYVILGTLVAGALGLISNLILPWLGIFKFFAIGPAFSALFLGVMSYAILRHGLFNLRVIAAEIFTILLALAMVANLFVSSTRNEVITRSATLVVVIIVGSLLIRSVIREVRSKEKIEQLAKDLEIANEELRKLDEAKSEFISLAGHQLRAPLTVIKGYTSMLMEGSFGELNKKAAKALDCVFLSANNLTKLVSELLDLSRIEAGRLKYDFKKIYFDDVIESVVKEFAEVSKAKQIEIRFKNENHKTFAVSGDAEKLHEVVINLLDNAIKYSKTGPVIVVLKPRSKRLALSIADSGLGIPKDEISKLFQKFGRTEIAKKEHPDGMGLGLYFVKKIIDDHKGRIWAESEGIGNGSVFYIELPII